MVFAVSDGGDFGQNVAAHRTFEDHAKSIGDILGKGADMMLDSRDMVDPAVRRLWREIPDGRKSGQGFDRHVPAAVLLGDFDPEENPYGKMDRSRLACSDHKEAGGTGGQRVCDSAGKQGAAAPSGRRHRQGCRCGAAFNENYTCWYCGYAPGSDAGGQRACRKSWDRTECCLTKALTM